MDLNCRIVVLIDALQEGKENPDPKHMLILR